MRSSVISLPTLILYYSLCLSSAHLAIDTSSSSLLELSLNTSLVSNRSYFVGLCLRRRASLMVSSSQRSIMIVPVSSVFIRPLH